jgi:hypothetical protein
MRVRGALIVSVIAIFQANNIPVIGEERERNDGTESIEIILKLETILHI